MRADPASGNCCNPPARSGAGVGTCPRPRNSLTVTDFGGVDIGIHQAMRRSQVMQLTIAITAWLRRSAGHRQPWIFPRRRRLPGREVPTTTPTHGSATGKHRVLGRCLLCLNGQGPSELEMEADCRRLGEIVAAGGQIARVQLYTVARTPAVAEAGPLPNEELERIGEIIRRRVGGNVEIYHSAMAFP